jgi:hypothetical protein
MNQPFRFDDEVEITLSVPRRNRKVSGKYIGGYSGYNIGSYGGYDIVSASTATKPDLDFQERSPSRFDDILVRL